VALLLVPGMWGFITVNMYMETLQISGNGPRLAKILAVAVATNLAVNLAFTRWGGLAVPAVASSLAYLLAGGAVVRCAARTAGVPVRRFLWPGRQAV